MPLLLTPLATARPLAVDLAGIVPHAVADRSPHDIARLPVTADGRPCELGELFHLVGDAADGQIACRGDFSRVHRVGAGMKSGRIDVSGDVGRRAAESMSGGILCVAGSAGDWLAAGLSGGEVRVQGSVGDNAAAATTGSDVGMRGGLVVVGGDAGCLAGARMRRGILAIAGACGDAAAFEMRAGTVMIGGRVGRHSALGMRRGSLVALSGPADVPPNFRRGAAWHPAFLPLLLRRLERSGFRAAAALHRGPWRQWHGDGLGGGRGEWFQPEDGG